MNGARDLGGIEAARDRIAGRVRHTPMEPSPTLSDRVGHPVHLKFEHHQRTGSFKLRGATNAVLSLPEAERRAGVVTVSTGNHGRALARAAREAGTRATVVMSRLVPGNKREAIAGEGAEIRIHGRSQDEAQVEAERLAREEGMILVPPFDHPDVVAGQGTLGLEIAESLPGARVALIPVSGGGLFVGVGTALKARCPGIRLVGVSMARGAAMQASLAAGRPVEVEELPTLADSLGGGVGLRNRHTVAATRELIDDLILLSEAEIAAGMRHCYRRERQVVEGGAAVGVAALLAGKVRPDGPCVTILTGANVDMDVHHRVVSGEDVDLMREAAAAAAEA
jgi:threonine dehydratase